MALLALITLCLGVYLKISSILKIPAFVLMPNHVHILATPKTPLSASRVMQSVEGVTPKYLIKLITALEPFGKDDLSLH